MSRSLLSLVLAAALPACSWVPRIPGITPYRIELQQGNFVSQEMLSQLKPGMSKEQVRLTMGTPLLADAFHADRWDYIYTREAPNGKRESRKLVVFFADNKLARVDGDGVQLERPKDQPVPPPATQAPVAPAVPLPPAEEKR
jgi:outer membrane protein assembly factor BamE